MGVQGGGSTDVILKYLICIWYGQRYPPKDFVKSAILGNKGHSLEASKRIWSRLICYSHFSGVYIGSVSSRECLDAPAILATFTAGRTGLVIV